MIYSPQGGCGEVGVEVQQGGESICWPTFFSLLSSIGVLSVPCVTSPNKKHSLVISSWLEREEPCWGSTWRSAGRTQSRTRTLTSGRMDVHRHGQPDETDIWPRLSFRLSCRASFFPSRQRRRRSERDVCRHPQVSAAASCPANECTDRSFHGASPRQWREVVWGCEFFFLFLHTYTHTRTHACQVSSVRRQCLNFNELRAGSRGGWEGGGAGGGGGGGEDGPCLHHCSSLRDWSKPSMCCTHLSLFKAPWCSDLQPMARSGFRLHLCRVSRQQSPHNSTHGSNALSSVDVPASVRTARLACQLGNVWHWVGNITMVAGHERFAKAASLLLREHLCIF